MSSPVTVSESSEWSSLSSQVVNPVMLCVLEVSQYLFGCSEVHLQGGAVITAECGDTE